MPDSHNAIQDELLTVKRSLEDYISHVKQAIDNSGDKLHIKEKNKMETECDKCLRWLESSSSLGVQELVNQQKHLQLLCGPYLAKLFGPEGALVSCRLEAHRDDDEDPSGTGGSGYSGKGTPGSVLGTS